MKVLAQTGSLRMQSGHPNRHFFFKVFRTLLAWFFAKPTNPYFHDCLSKV
jgi:hypothetical protein